MNSNGRGRRRRQVYVGPGVLLLLVVIVVAVLAGVFLSPRVVVGLSVHMCCMIEKINKKTPFEDHLDYQKFVESEQVFIERMRISMEELCAFYHVEIPLGELAYIHDYIKNDRNGEDFYA